jgi:hypothetical protein
MSQERSVRDVSGLYMRSMERAMGIEPTSEAWEATKNTKNVRFGGFFAFFGFLSWIPIRFLDCRSDDVRTVCLRP